MAASFTLPTVLANLAAGNQALTLIDGDLTTLRDPLLSLNTFSNVYTDAGAANAYVITVSTPQTVSQAQGLRVQFIATNANTAASTLQINALAVKSIKNSNGTALSAGQIPANAIVDVIYDGTQYLLLNASNFSGSTAWTPVDRSTASLTFTGVSATYEQIGSTVFARGTLVYPATATTSLAAISLPVPVPNQPYAQTPGPVWCIGGPASASFSVLMAPIKNTSSAGLYNGLLSAGSQQANSQFTLTTITFMCSYPAV